MPSWSGKTRGGVTGYKIFVFTIKHLGLPFAYFLLRFVVLYFVFASPKALRPTFIYFRRIHKYSFFKSLISIYNNYFVFGQTLIDKLTMLSEYNKKLTFNFDGENNLQKMVDENTGGLLIGAHVGSFEIAGYLLKRIDAKVNILMFEAEHENIKKYLSTVYKGMNTNIIAIKDDMSHLYEIKKAFENKEFLCFHGDRFLDNTKTITQPFMGHEARFAAGPFYLALIYNVPVSYFFAMKEKKFHYHFYATPPKLYYQEKSNHKSRDLALASILKDYINVFEFMLKKYPEQWFNFYYFWEKK